ncbi:hypothetical protein FB561_6550 [Kribbella amoyensis]|uniref:Uncharacterized protein n=1 Tax=Kribbella amoyensis TaxID=996641 RepID=A0A561B8U7_9ACTN|nr:hypothetical protein [Kribbella amoyensis]TWD75112.1 hypothetical protein FB561_6550 [Kribbella amoyensis]
MRTLRLLPGAALLLALVACSSTDPGSTAQDAAPVGTPTTASPTPAPTTTSQSPATPSPSKPSPTKPAEPRAADGFDYQACRDAVCEVYVKTGSKVPVKRSVAGFSTLVVSKVAATGVAFGGRTPNISVSASGQRAGSRSRLNGLDITTVAVNPPLAILRLRTS